MARQSEFKNSVIEVIFWVVKGVLKEVLLAGPACKIFRELLPLLTCSLVECRDLIGPGTKMYTEKKTQQEIKDRLDAEEFQFRTNSPNQIRRRSSIYHTQPMVAWKMDIELKMMMIVMLKGTKILRLEF